MRPITQTFLTSSTWTSPPNYQGPVFLQGCGGGSGGTGGTQGGKGSKFYQLMIQVEPFTTYDVVVGEGGSGGVGISNPGSVGGDTSFGDLATFPGGNSTDVLSFPGGFGVGLTGIASYSPGLGGYPGPFGAGGGGAGDAAAATEPPIKNSGAGGGGGNYGVNAVGSTGSAGRLSVTWWP